MSTTALNQFHDKFMDGLEFCSRTYALFESIREAPNGPSRMRMRPTTLEKKLLEELLPICKYVQASYRTGRYISVRWLNGNQQYDAEVKQHGAYVNDNFYPATGYLEVTCTMHPKEYLIREVLEKKGMAFDLKGIFRLKNGEIESRSVGYTNHEHIDSYSKLLLNQILRKSKKRYPKNTTLIIQCSLDSIYMPDEWEILMTKVRENLPKRITFREIYLYDPQRQYSHSIDPHSDACHFSPVQVTR